MVSLSHGVLATIPLAVRRRWGEKTAFLRQLQLEDSKNVPMTRRFFAWDDERQSFKTGTGDGRQTRPSGPSATAQIPSLGAIFCQIPVLTWIDPCTYSMTNKRGGNRMDFAVVEVRKALERRRRLNVCIWLLSIATRHPPPQRPPAGHLTYETSKHIVGQFWERTLPEAFPERGLSSHVASKCCSDSLRQEEDLYMPRKSITILLSRHTYFMQAR